MHIYVSYLLLDIPDKIYQFQTFQERLTAKAQFHKNDHCCAENLKIKRVSKKNSKILLLFQGFFNVKASIFFFQLLAPGAHFFSSWVLLKPDFNIKKSTLGPTLQLTNQLILFNIEPTGSMLLD